MDAPNRSKPGWYWQWSGRPPFADRAHNSARQPMQIRIQRVLLAAAGAAVLFSGVPLGAAGPQAGAATARPAVPRAADGKPDLSGIWGVMNTANWNILPHPASTDGPGGTGLVIGNELPYLPSALAKKQENYRTRMTADTDARCLLPGVPRVMYEPYPFQIFQTPGVVTMAFEVRPRDEKHLHEHATSRRPDRVVDGRFTRPLGGGHAGG